MTQKVHAFKATYGITKDGELTGGELLQNVKKPPESKPSEKSVEKRKRREVEGEEKKEETSKGAKGGEMEEDIEKDSKYSARIECVRL